MGIELFPPNTEGEPHLKHQKAETEPLVERRLQEGSLKRGRWVAAGNVLDLISVAYLNYSQYTSVTGDTAPCFLEIMQMVPKGVRGRIKILQDWLAALYIHIKMTS